MSADGIRSRSLRGTAFTFFSTARKTPDRRQYAPSLRTTAPTVREMIRISSPMDQLST